MRIANLQLLSEALLHEWASQDGISENDPALVRLASALGMLRDLSRANKTREEYRAAYKLCLQESDAAMKAYCDVHGKQSIRYPYSVVLANCN